MNSLVSAITCAIPPKSGNGEVICSNPGDASYGDVCTWTCDSGYSGNAPVTCGDSNGDGTGDFDTLPTCTGKFYKNALRDKKGSEIFSKAESFPPLNTTIQF